jgi:CheY-like chemotaxis protein
MIEIGDRQLTLLARLVDDLLDVSRITANKIELRPETIDLREIVDTAVTTSKPRIADRRHALVPQISEAPIPVTVDSLRLVQVISNLLNNAARYTQPNGRVEIHCGIAGERAFVTVKDNGIGIPSDLLPTIFDMFVQERTTPDGAGGLGLGLGLVKRLVELHGGSVRATSAGPGLGSTFEIVLALHQPPPDDLVARSPTMPRPRTASLRAVVCDDAPDLRDLVADLLRLHGHEVTIVENGSSAVQTICDELPDVALIDIGLPDMDGYEVAREIRRRLTDHRPRLIAMTGYGQASDRASAFEAGFDDHIIKPASADTILGALHGSTEKS